MRSRGTFKNSCDEISLRKTGDLRLRAMLLQETTDIRRGRVHPVVKRLKSKTELTCNWTRGMQLANTPPLQSTAPGLHPVSIHQTAPPVRGSKYPITAYYSIYRPRTDERLSRPAWLVKPTYRNKVPPPGVEPGHVTHPSTNRAQRRVTLLIRPTLLPLRHAATQHSSVAQKTTTAASSCTAACRSCLSRAAEPPTVPRSCPPASVRTSPSSPACCRLC